MFFIILSIALFLLRTLTIFQVQEYESLNVYKTPNLTEHVLIHNTQQHEVISIFDQLEWICKTHLQLNDK